MNLTNLCILFQIFLSTALNIQPIVALKSFPILEIGENEVRNYLKSSFDYDSLGIGDMGIKKLVLLNEAEAYSGLIVERIVAIITDDGRLHLAYDGVSMHRFDNVTIDVPQGIRIRDFTPGPVILAPKSVGYVLTDDGQFLSLRHFNDTHQVFKFDRNDVRIKKIAIGFSAFFALTEDSQVYVTDTLSGTMDLNALVTKRIDFSNVTQHPIVDIAYSGYALYALDESGKLFKWLVYDCGESPCPNIDMSPTEMELPSSSPIKAFGPLLLKTVAIFEDGSCWVWHFNSHGRFHSPVKLHENITGHVHIIPTVRDIIILSSEISQEQEMSSQEFYMNHLEIRQLNSYSGARWKTQRLRHWTDVLNWLTIYNKIDIHIQVVEQNPLICPKNNLGLFNLNVDHMPFTDIAFQLSSSNNNIKTVAAHRSILSAFSPVFHEQFSHLDNESSAISLNDYSYESFLTFLQFVYHGEPVKFESLSSYQLLELKRMAEYYQSDRLGWLAMQRIESIIMSPSQRIDSTQECHEPNITPLFNDPQYSDVAFEFPLETDEDTGSPKQISAHKIILSVASDAFFKRFMNGEWSNTSTIQIKSYPYSAFYRSIEYIYTSKSFVNHSLDLREIIQIQAIAKDFEMYSFYLLSQRELTKRLESGSDDELISEMEKRSNPRRIKTQIAEKLESRVNESNFLRIAKATYSGRYIALYFTLKYFKENPSLLVELEQDGYFRQVLNSQVNAFSGPGGEKRLRQGHFGKSDTWCHN